MIGPAKKSLKDLEREGLIQLPGNFNGIVSGGQMIITDLKWPHLKSVLLIQDGIRLNCTLGDIYGWEAAADICSSNTPLLKQINILLQTMLGKSIYEVFSTRLDLSTVRKMER